MRNYDNKIWKKNDFSILNGDSLIVRREIMPNGKSRSFINDCLIRLEVLKLLSSKIIDIHSQHENLLLNDEFFQLNFLDSLLTLTDLSYSDTLKDFQKKFLENQELFQKIEKFKLNSKSEKEKFENLIILPPEIIILDSV